MPRPADKEDPKTVAGMPVVNRSQKEWIRMIKKHCPEHLMCKVSILIWWDMNSMKCSDVSAKDGFFREQLDAYSWDMDFDYCGDDIEKVLLKLGYSKTVAKQKGFETDKAIARSMQYQYQTGARK